MYELSYPGVSATWSMNGQTCLTWNEDESGTYQYCTSESSPCLVTTSVGDSGLNTYSAVGGGQYEITTGIFTCPDGTQVNLGSDFGGCPLLNVLLHSGPDDGCDETDLSCR